MGRRARSSTDLNRQQRSCLYFSGIVSLKIRNSLVCIIQIEWNISMKFVISSDYFCPILKNPVFYWIIPILQKFLWVHFILLLSKNCLFFIFIPDQISGLSPTSDLRLESKFMTNTFTSPPISWAIWLTTKIMSQQKHCREQNIFNAVPTKVTLSWFSVNDINLSSIQCSRAVFSLLLRGRSLEIPRRSVPKTKTEEKKLLQAGLLVEYSRKGVKAIICSSWCNLAKSIDWHNQ